MSINQDTIRDVVVARAAKLNMSAYAIAQACGGAVNEDTVRKYLRGDASMGSDRLQHVFKALRLRVAASAR